MKGNLVETAKIGKGGQLNIPKEIREFLELEPGHHLGFVIEDDKVILHPLTKTIRDFRGSVVVKAPQDLAKVKKKVMNQRAKKRAKPHH